MKYNIDKNSNVDNHFLWGSGSIFSKPNPKTHDINEYTLPKLAQTPYSLSNISVLTKA